MEEAPDGVVALAQLRASHQRFIVLLDLLMPELDGLHLLQTIAAEPPLTTRHAYIVFTAAPHAPTPHWLP